MSPLEEFRKNIDEVYGVYLDSVRGFDLIVDDHNKNNVNISDAELKKRRIFYGVGNPNSNDSYVLHKTTQYEYRERNKKEGRNRVVLANQSIVQIYQYWEDKYREEIAKLFGKKKNELKSPIFGDFRLLRVSIIHNHGIAISSIKNCELLKWFKPGEVISIDNKMFEKAIFHVKVALDEFENKLHA
jgi:hypothetical protein